MRKLTKTLLMLFLGSYLAGCTINYQIEPMHKPVPVPTTAAAATDASLDSIPPTPVPLTKPSCLVVNMAELDGVTEIKRDDYRATKDVVGYIKDLEEQQKILLKAKDRYERCKN